MVILDSISYFSKNSCLSLLILQEWNTKAEEDKKRYERELAKWKSEGGDEALKAAKKQAKKEKRAAEGKGPSKSSKPKSSATVEKTLSSAGTGTSYKSKEYIEDSDSSDQYQE